MKTALSGRLSGDCEGCAGGIRTDRAVLARMYRGTSLIRKRHPPRTWGYGRVLERNCFS
jgi:hypothetical protein